MDRFTRNYIAVFAVIGLAALVWAFYEDLMVAKLNDLLEADTALAAYPYRFRVLRLENGIATMSTPRSFAFPVYRALGILYPLLSAENKRLDCSSLVKFLVKSGSRPGGCSESLGSVSRRGILPCWR